MTDITSGDGTPTALLRAADATSPSDEVAGRRADTEAIENLLYRYAEALDTRNFDLLATCFSHSATIHLGSFGQFAGRGAIVEALGRIVELRATQHLITNPVISVAGPSARAASYLLAQHIRMDGTQFTVGGRYDDELEQIDGSWLITARVLEETWTAGMTPDTASGIKQLGMQADRSTELDLLDGARGLLSNYATCIDSRDWDGLAALFAPDAKVHFGENLKLSGRQEIVAHIRGVLVPQMVTQHLVANVQVESATEVSAGVRSELLAQHVLTGSVPFRALLVGGTYSDQITPGHGGWVFSDRRFHFVWEDGDASLLPVDRPSATSTTTEQD